MIVVRDRGDNVPWQSPALQPTFHELGIAEQSLPASIDEPQPPQKLMSFMVSTLKRGKLIGVRSLNFTKARVERETGP